MNARAGAATVAAVVAVAAAIAAAAGAAWLATTVPRPAPVSAIAPAASPAPANVANVAIGFTPPPAGSYRLERILPTPDGLVLDSDGSVHRLREFTTGKVTLFSFIYTACSDTRGCPLATAVLHAVKARVAQAPALRGKVRFVSMSFYPAIDTPPMMRSYGGDDARPSVDAPWYFLTTQSAQELAPLLTGFGQDAVVAGAGPGASAAAPAIRHLLKVYLIDAGGTVREIYAPAYLHPQLVYNDVLTVLAQAQE